MAMAALVKAVPVRLTGVAPIARGDLHRRRRRWDEVDDAVDAARRPGVFVAGEMLDWEAPTGGYLLQACFATGARRGPRRAGLAGRTSIVRAAAA